MKVYGSVLVTRKALITQKFGAEAWHGLFRDLAVAHPYFRRPITASSSIPLPEHFAFHDELVRRFYPGGTEALVELGATSARWAHSEGPLRQLITNTEVTSLVAEIPKLFHRYFSETDAHTEAHLLDSGVEFRFCDLPAWHPFFEHVTLGYIKGMLELFCANPISTRRLTVGRGTTYRYLLSTDPGPVGATAYAAAAGGGHPRSKALADENKRTLRPRQPITKREFEVLRLV